jgi:hypothetical protein
LDPEDKNSMQWKDWYVRHKFGPMAAAAINTADIHDLDILLDYVRHVRQTKRLGESMEDKESNKLI